MSRRATASHERSEPPVLRKDADKSMDPAEDYYPVRAAVDLGVATPVSEGPASGRSPEIRRRRRGDTRRKPGFLRVYVYRSMVWFLMGSFAGTEFVIEFTRRGIWEISDWNRQDILSGSIRSFRILVKEHSTWVCLRGKRKLERYLVNFRLMVHFNGRESLSERIFVWSTERRIRRRWDYRN